MGYSHRIRNSVLKKVLPPVNIPVRDVARETGISESV